ncbi:MAG: hypothetical protein AAFY03_08605 [Pseudomonadota bacterium]
MAIWSKIEAFFDRRCILFTQGRLEELMASHPDIFVIYRPDGIEVATSREEGLAMMRVLWTRAREAGMARVTAHLTSINERPNGRYCAGVTVHHWNSEDESLGSDDVEYYLRQTDHGDLEVELVNMCVLRSSIAEGVKGGLKRANNVTRLR